MIAAHPDLAQRLALIESVPGIGQRTAIAILIRLPEIEDLSREQAAALAGGTPPSSASTDDSETPENHTNSPS